MILPHEVAVVNVSAGSAFAVSNDLRLHRELGLRRGHRDRGVWQWPLVAHGLAVFRPDRG
jgi:hypothetical protein